MAKHHEPEDVAEQSLRSRKQARTRRELEAAAVALFEDKGYEETRVEEIAGEVEVSPRTFFRYFGSKEDVLFGYEEDQVAELRRMIRDCPTAATDLSALEEVLLTLANYLAGEYQPLLIRATIVAQNPRLRERSLRVQRSWELTLADELASQAGIDAPDLNLLVLAASMMGALNVAVRVWQASGGQGSLVTVVKRALELATSPEIPGPASTRKSDAVPEEHSGRSARPPLTIDHPNHWPLEYVGGRPISRSARPRHGPATGKASNNIASG